MKKIKLPLVILVTTLFLSVYAKAELPALSDIAFVDLPHTFNSSSTEGYLDLDNNNSPDFFIHFHNYDSEYSYCEIYGADAIASPSPGLTLMQERNMIIGESPYVSPPAGPGLQLRIRYYTTILSAGELISEDSENWVPVSYFFRNNPPESPAPLSGTYNDDIYSGYIGVYFLGTGGQFHYGWLSVTLDPNGNFVTLNGSSYNPNPGQPIAAGAGGSAVPVPFIASILGFGLIGGGILIKRRKRNK